MHSASATVGIPCLRKDFIVDEFQLLEARDNAAEAILRVVVALTDRELSTLTLAAPTETTVHRRRNMLVREETE